MTTRRHTAPLTLIAAAAAAAVALPASTAQAESVTVIVENLAPDNGLFLTPVFVALHDGSVDLFDSGAAVSAGFERLAEDGSTSFLADEVRAASSSAVIGALPGGFGEFPPPAVLGPSGVASLTLEVDPTTNRFFSYATMVIPSNDAFIGNDDATALQLFDADGNFQSLSFTVFGESVMDAGTEANNELNAAFLNQSVADAGTAISGVVTAHEGFNGSFANPDGTPMNVLGGTNPMGIEFGETAADFSIPGTALARFSVVIPTPAAAAAGLCLLAPMALRRRRSHV